MAKELYSKSKYEVLAPAGSYQCMVAAFNAGADAVYLGGNMFGARANANNFTKEELLDAIDYAHLRGKKIFLTVNTLIKNREIREHLFEYIKTYYEAGLDAVIVQDIGVLEFIKSNFPHMDIHASTQMTVTGKEFAHKLKDGGVTRIVPARELSTEEIKDIYDETGLEIECFVHGALCYCYSGMCLLSSVIGGRSGNRGRCAQPCRLPYDVEFEDRVLKNQYPLSPADLCTLEILPDILESGVYSLKIEGRMKKPEYVASVVSMYRKYVDMYEKKGRAGYKVAPDDIEKLKDIYNRGEFTTGYYHTHNGKEIMSVNRPNHTGTKAAVILSYDNKTNVLKAKAVKELHFDDVLEIFAGQGIDRDIELPGVNASAGQIFTVKPRERIKANILGRNIMRTRNNSLISDIDKAYISNDKISKVPIGGNVVVSANMPVTIDVWNEYGSAHVEGEVPVMAQNRPVTYEDIRKQITKTGGTDFTFDDSQLTISVDEGLFVNIKDINMLRRDVLAILKDNICGTYRRDVATYTTLDSDKSDDSSGEAIQSALVSDIGQFEAVVGHESIDAVYVESYIADNSIKWNELISDAHNNHKRIYMALPYVFRVKGKKFFDSLIDFLQDNKLDGFVFRNMEELCWFEQRGIDIKNAIFDNTIYGFNDIAIEKLSEYSPYLITSSYELNEREILELKCSNLEHVVYGYIPVMFSAGCIKKTYDRCDGHSSVTSLKDRMGNRFKAVSNCTFCYNVIYNSKPTVLMDVIDERKKGIASRRYNFTTESPSQIKAILEGKYEGDYTRGHYKRGVE